LFEDKRSVLSVEKAGLKIGKSGRISGDLIARGRRREKLGTS